MLQNLQLAVVRCDQAAHHARIAHHALQLRLRRLQIALRRRDIRLHAAHIRPYARNVGRNRAHLFRRRRLLLCKLLRRCGCRLLRRQDALRPQFDLFLRHPHTLAQRLTRGPQPGIRRLQLRG